MGRRAVNLTNPVPVPEVPALVGLQSWKMAEGGLPCSVGVQTSPAFHAQQTGQSQHSITEGANGNVSVWDEWDRKNGGMTSKGKSLCRAVSREGEGMTSERAVKDATRQLFRHGPEGRACPDVKVIKTHSHLAGGLANRPSGRQSYSYTNGSVIAVQVAGKCSTGLEGLQFRLHKVKHSVWANEEKIRTLLNIIQDLERNTALRQGRCSYRTGQDLNNCCICQKTACIIYSFSLSHPPSVEHDFRQQEKGMLAILHSLENKPLPSHSSTNKMNNSKTKTKTRVQKLRNKCFWWL
ncbi:hypothetical protein AAFF_G00302680 [Aldrovandia affinis]|uniref:Uncharacterized protein n=1 Tax=Aldrovandia affinis TaxID=143900 RepID=A0AAD7R881_9TELE|nr:hypothetical protein AAFF_G00302680 [Aldrovandia affinis]